MSGTIYNSGILTLFNTASRSSPDSALLNTIYGYNTGGTSGSGQSPVQALLSAQKNQAADVKQTEQNPAVKTTMAAFTKTINSATTLQQALNNPAVLNVLLTANGLSDQIGNTALAVKVLTSNLQDPASLANVLTDTRWKTLAQTYNLASNGLKILKNPATIAAITQGYAQITWEKSQDTSTPGISSALTFIQQAGSIRTVDQVLGNETVLKVVETALGVPEDIAFQDLTAQEQAISTRIDVKNFKNPTFVQNFADRFMTMNNAALNNSTSSSSDLTTLAARLTSHFPG
jgi:hypothetical protein